MIFPAQDTAAISKDMPGFEFLIVSTSDGLSLNILLHRPEPNEPSVVMFHGTADRVVPIDHGQALLKAAPDGTRFVTIEGAGHNDLENHDVTRQAIDFFRSPQ